MKKIMMVAGIGLIVVIAIVLVLVFVVFKVSAGEDDTLNKKLFFKCEEQYTNIPLEDGSYKVLKVEMTIIYTNPDFEEILIEKKLEIKDFINGYFRETTMEAVNRPNGKDRIKEDILEEMIEMFETDSDNFIKILLPQFIIP